MNAPTNIQRTSSNMRRSSRSLLLTLVVALFAAIALLLIAVGRTDAQAQEETIQSSQTATTAPGAWAWGWNHYGQLGNGTYNPNMTPSAVAGLSDAKDAAGGSRHSLVVKNDGTVVASGDNSYGQLGNTQYGLSRTPIPVQGLSEANGVAAGYYHSLAAKNDGTVWAWGWNIRGQLGDGTNTDRYTPVQVQGLSDVKAVAAGYRYSMAIKSDGTVWAWGDNRSGQLGDGTRNSSNTPVQVQGLSDVQAIAAGSDHNLALKNDGTVVAWGENAYGGLGDGTYTDRYTPVQVSGLSDVKAIAAGSFHSLAVKSDGTVVAWGDNGWGQLGDGTIAQTGGTMNSNFPIAVKDPSDPTGSLHGVQDVAGGDTHSLAVKSNGTVVAWGDNDRGQLGNGTYNYWSSTPVAVQGLSDANEVAGGYTHSLAIKSDGTLVAWGANNFGQLGDGTYNDRNTPVEVQGLSGVTDIAGGLWYSLAAVGSPDATLPTTTADAGSYQPDTWTNKDVSLTLTASDEGGSGVDKIYYNTDGSTSYQQYTAPLSVTNEGTTTVSYYATDKAGNKESPQTFTIRIDKSAPTTTATRSAQPNANGWYNKDVTITLRATDQAALSGVKEITYSATGAQPVTETKVPGSSKQLTITKEGQTTITYFATDNAANAGQPKTLTIKMNKSAPRVLSVSPAENATGVARGANVTATFSEDMLASSINTPATTFKLFKKGSTSALSATVSYNPTTRTATLNPFGSSTTLLARGTTYKAVVTTGAKDQAGTALDQKPSVAGSQQKVWYFTIRT